ncbi:histidinol-phosphate transaminase [Butyrivibrio sp. INlla16]|uniref:histidinol-phosphate transaminase n=1 Tax=Butyrivibrio sp. INlla16 TaxID=1520807 RepID=UPI00088DC69B|nr:histidinol-phosphate transaminase [Butyrivibrio sp. INlla16]SDB10461.1 histidinol-phosphate aminotransferase [Butyrivibrio sp. INlla16]
MSWEKSVRRVNPYVPGEQPKNKNIIKLNTNECPYPPAPAVNTLIENMKYEDMRLYPDPEAEVLVEALSRYYDVPEDQIFVGVGSDDVLSMAYLTFFNSDKPVLFPDITYSFYDVWAELYKVPYEQIPLDENFKIRFEDYYEENHPNGGVIIANPNAPVGIFEPVSEIEKVIAHNPNSVCIIDEAYIDFGGESALPLIEKYDNVLVVQTFSKSRAMAGMRIGYAFGSKKLIGYLKDAKFSFNSYTMNRPSLELGVAAIKDDVYFKETCAKIINTRERVKKELAELGFTFPDSKANFIFAKHEKVSGEELFLALKEAGIYVRHWNAERISDYLRITIGTDEEMDKLVAFLKDYLSEK